MSKRILLLSLGLGVFVSGCDVHISPHVHRPHHHVVVHSPPVIVGHSHTYTYSHYGYHFGHHTYRYYGHGHHSHHGPHFGWRRHKPRCR